MKNKQKENQKQQQTINAQNLLSTDFLGTQNEISNKDTSSRSFQNYDDSQLIKQQINWTKEVKIAETNEKYFKRYNLNEKSELVEFADSKSYIDQNENSKEESQEQKQIGQIIEYEEKAMQLEEVNRK